MNAVDLLGWAAWSPGIEDEQAWREWARAPHKLEREGMPDVAFLPALQRRRCDQLSRMALRVAHDGCPAFLRSEVASVFASRHGSFRTMVSLLDELACERPMSPTRFSHSVHNTQAGLFSIWAENRNLSTCVAAGADTFAHGFLEALSCLRRAAGHPVLLVVGDEAVPEPLSELAESDHGAYAVALLLRSGAASGAASEVASGTAWKVASADSGYPSIRLEHRARDSNETKPGPPAALRFVQWLVGSEPSLEIASGYHSWVWQRTEPTAPALPGR